MAYREVKYKGEGLRNLNKRIEEIFRRGEEVIYWELISIDVGRPKTLKGRKANNGNK